MFSSRWVSRLIILVEVEDILWHKQVSLKMSIFAWHISCVIGCQQRPTWLLEAFFLQTSILVWQVAALTLVRSWIDFSAVDAHSLSDHFVQFTYSAGGLWAWRSFLQLVWLACVWVVWNKRNLWIFSNSENSVTRLLDKVKHFPIGGFGRRILL
jgi:hypothetical protein